MESYSSNRPLPFNKSLLIDRSISARPLSHSTCLAFSRIAKRLASNSASFKSSSASFVSSLLVIAAFQVMRLKNNRRYLWCQPLPSLLDKGGQQLFLPPSNHPAHQRSCHIPVCYGLRCCPREHSGWNRHPLDQQ